MSNVKYTFLNVLFLIHKDVLSLFTFVFKISTNVCSKFMDVAVFQILRAFSQFNNFRILNILLKYNILRLKTEYIYILNAFTLFFQLV